MSYFKIEKQCKDCNSTFLPYQYNQVRCGDCVKLQGKKYKGPTITNCKGCGIEFQKTSPQMYYCTEQCKCENMALIRQYGITRIEWNLMYDRQNGTCAICNGKGFVLKKGKYIDTTLCVDHDHNTGEVRGLLCHNCNRALGLFKEDRAVLKKALEYLSESATTMVKTSTPKQVEAQRKGRKNVHIHK